MPSTTPLSRLEPAAEPPEKPRKSRRKDKRGLPAHIVFFLLAPIALLSIAVVFVLGPPFIWVPVLACVLLGWALYINDRKGFVRSSQMRRAHEPRRHFSMIEVFLLMGLIIGNVLVGIYVFVRQ